MRTSVRRTARRPPPSTHSSPVRAMQWTTCLVMMVLEPHVSCNVRRTHMLPEVYHNPALAHPLGKRGMPQQFLHKSLQLMRMAA